MDFLQVMFDRAKKDIKTIVLPEGTDIRTIKAASIVSSKGFAKVIVLGKIGEIQKISHDIDLSGVTVLDHIESDLLPKYAELYYEMRKHKGITVEHAKEIMKHHDDAWKNLSGKIELTKEHALEAMKNPLFFGVMMVKTGDADGMVAGAINSTANTLRPALQIIKTAPHVKMVSTSAVMVVPKTHFGHEGILCFADVGLVENPSSEELADIAVSTAETFNSLVGQAPKVAMLSYSTFGSARSEQTEKVVSATQIVKNKHPHLKIDGEMQLDAAIIPSVAQLKAPHSSVAGSANVLIFPDLNSANIGCKLTQRFGDAMLYGPIMQGLAKPVNDLSRGCTAEEIVGVIAITAVQAQAK